MNYIYILAISKEGPVKIGYSADPFKRMRQLQTGQSETLQVFHAQPLAKEKARLIEQLIHRQNRETKIKGEWFKLTVEQAIAEVDFAMIKYEDDPALNMYHKHKML